MTTCLHQIKPVFVPLRNGIRIFLPLLLHTVLLLMGSATANGQKPFNIPNPVLPGVADAGVIKFNGRYYIGGVATKGSFYASDDLVKWQAPVHVFSMNNEWATKYGVGDEQIHACDINYINGRFHMYWSVNYWGKERNIVHIGHAVSASVLGPYTEPVKDTWLDNRIDPKLFIDDDGKAYLYMVRFTDGNTIWVRPMKDPQTFSGEPVYLFASLPNTWETLDNRVEEGPWVMKYRNRYYLMFNANHTSPAWGNYALGVAEAGSPAGFNNGSKYSYPLLQSNQPDMEDSCVDLLKYASEKNAFLYTTNNPGNDWNTENYDASGWQTGKAGFGSTVIRGSTTRIIRTFWKTTELWARTAFAVDKKTTKSLMLRINHDGETKVFLNGQMIYENSGRNYTTWNLDKQALALVKEGKNVLAVNTHGGRQSNYLDVALFDTRGLPGDDILFSPGQPNILRGPNGFEWWLIYMANKNSDNRGQYIDRIHFFDKRMFAEGVTSVNTPGYHPSPARPTFSGLFAGDERQFKNQWHYSGETWKIVNRELIQTGKAPAHALIKSKPAGNYLFEAGVRLSGTAAKAGVIAWWKDESHWLRIVFDQKKKACLYELKLGNKTGAAAFRLPPDFAKNVYHKISVFRNASSFNIRIDDLPAPFVPAIKTPVSGEGIPGLYAEGATAFDGIVYTIGWDEFDSTITGWGSSVHNEKATGTWSVSQQGISQSKASGINVAFKGDTLQEYEASMQVQTQDSAGSAGMYAVYIDPDNYLKAVFDFTRKKFIVSGKENGNPVTETETQLERIQTCYADMKYTDFMEKHFSLPALTYVNAIHLSKVPYGNADTLIDDLYSKTDIFYKDQNKWYPITGYKQIPSIHPGFSAIKFDPVKTQELKFVNKQADDRNIYVYKIRVNELCKNTYNLRAVKLKEKIIFFVDGKEILQVKNHFPASQIGLVTENMKASFNGITVFHLPGRDE